MNSYLKKNNKFIFTIIDDTDDAYFESIKPVYDILIKNGLRTTKTIWVEPVKDNKYSKGHCLKDKSYRNFIIDLKSKGFEIALHNVGSGDYKREKIIKGLEIYKDVLGEYPNIHINHSYNKDNIYCGPKRFSFPFNIFVKYFYSKYNNFYGEVIDSPYYWGDIHKKIINYSRNYELDDINTLKINPYMPYKDKKYEDVCNNWFSSTFAPNQWLFNHMVNKRSIDRLEQECGVCILYTHLGYFYKKEKVDIGFKKMIEYVGKKENALFMTVSETLDFLDTHKNDNLTGNYLPKFIKFKLEFQSLLTRIKYRYFRKIDDFHFKKSNTYKEI